MKMLSSELLKAVCIFSAMLSVFLNVCIYVSWKKKPASPALMYLSNHAVALVAVLLHKSVFLPYQRGFYCDDESIRLPFKNSTVPTSVLAAVGFTLPVFSVSPGVVKAGGRGEACVGARSVCQWLDFLSQSHTDLTAFTGSESHAVVMSHWLQIMCAAHYLSASFHCGLFDSNPGLQAAVSVHSLYQTHTKLAVCS